MEFCNDDGLKRTRMMPYHIVKKCDDMSICLDIVPALEKQTDGRICRSNIVLCLHCMLTRDKKSLGSRI